jgi:hypothetical protein
MTSPVPESKPASPSLRVSPTSADIQEYDPAEAEIVVAQASTTIEADDGEDNGYHTDTSSIGDTSISSSIRDYAFENGKRYHKFREGYYVFPNDESEQDREDMKHALVVNLCGGKLHFAPIGDNPQNIIDLGTGTGIWCMDSRYETEDPRWNADWDQWATNTQAHKS